MQRSLFGDHDVGAHSVAEWPRAFLQVAEEFRQSAHMARIRDYVLEEQDASSLTKSTCRPTGPVGGLHIAKEPVKAGL